MFFYEFCERTKAVARRCRVSLPNVCNVIKKKFQHSCFPMNFAKFLRTPISKCTSRWLLLKECFYPMQSCQKHSGRSFQLTWVTINNFKKDFTFSVIFVGFLFNLKVSVIKYCNPNKHVRINDQKTTER